MKEELWIEDSDAIASIYSDALRSAGLEFTAVAERCPPFACGAVHALFVRREDAAAYVASRLPPPVALADRVVVPGLPNLGEIATLWLSPCIAVQGEVVDHSGRFITISCGGKLYRGFPPGSLPEDIQVRPNVPVGGWL